MSESEMDAKAKEVLDDIRTLGPDCLVARKYGEHGKNKGFYTQDDIDEAISDFNLKKGVE
jgi:hypothetical protein